MPSITVIGNCQIAALQPVLRVMIKDLTILHLPSVYTMEERHRADVLGACEKADWILTQPISESYHVEFARTNVLRDAYPGKLIVWPNVYFAGYTPEIRTFYDPQTNHFEGPLFGYHSEKIVLGYLEGWSVEKTAALLGSPSALDEHWYGTAVEASLTELARREQGCDVTISGHIRQHFTKRRLFHIFNHPEISLIVRVAEQLCQKMGERKPVAMPPGLLSDYELISAWYPENPYIAETHDFAFRSPRVYRGIRSEHGGQGPYRADLPWIYDETELVEETFRFYAGHDARLREHGEVMSLLARDRG